MSIPNKKNILKLDPERKMQNFGQRGRGSFELCLSHKDFIIILVYLNSLFSYHD